MAHMQVMAFIEAKKRFFLGYAELRSFLCRAKVIWGKKKVLSGWRERQR